MSRRALWIAATVALLLLAFYIGTRALDRVFELSEESPGPERAVLILRDEDFFSEDFGRRAIAYLYEPKPEGSFLLERLSEPRPTIQEIRARYGKPEASVIEDMSKYGVARRAAVYSYGRLNLVAPEGDVKGRISWVIVR